MDNTKKVLDEILEERVRQDQKWGQQNHDPAWWMTILGEEFGEACEAALQAAFSEEGRSSVVWRY